MKYKIGSKIKLNGIDGKITNFHKGERSVNYFEAKLETEKPSIILFSKDGYVLPFTNNTPNQEKVKVID